MRQRIKLESSRRSSITPARPSLRRDRPPQNPHLLPQTDPLLQQKKNRPPANWGLIVRSYTRTYPDEVAGLVLVDTPEESSIFQPDVLSFYAKAQVMNRIVAIAARFGILRLLNHWLPLEQYGFWLTRPAEYSALCDDLVSVERVPASLRTSQSAGSLGALPLIVITHGQLFPGPFAVLEKNWDEGQKTLAALSTPRAN